MQRKGTFEQPNSSLPFGTFVPRFNSNQLCTVSLQENSRDPGIASVTDRHEVRRWKSRRDGLGNADSRRQPRCRIRSHAEGLSNPPASVLNCGVSNVPPRSMIPIGSASNAKLSFDLHRCPDPPPATALNRHHRHWLQTALHASMTET